MNFLKVLIVFLFINNFLFCEEKLNEFEMKMNNSLINIFQSKLDSNLLDSNLYIGLLKKYNNKAIIDFYDEYNKFFKIEYINKILTLKIDFKLDVSMQKKLKFSKLTVLSNNNLIKLKTNEITNFNVVFIEDSLKSEKVNFLFFTKQNYLNEEKLKKCLITINDILMKPDNIENFNKELFNDLKKLNSNGLSKLNFIEKFVKSEYYLWIFGLRDDENDEIVYIYFRNTEGDKLRIELKFNFEEKIYTLYRIRIGDFGEYR
jgi:hypothetical protein